MVQPDANKATKAKRKLNMDEAGNNQLEITAKRRPANTAIEITEYSTRQRVNKPSNLGKKAAKINKNNAIDATNEVVNKPNPKLGCSSDNNNAVPVTEVDDPQSVKHSQSKRGRKCRVVDKTINNDGHSKQAPNKGASHNSVLNTN